MSTAAAAMAQRFGAAGGAAPTETPATQGLQPTPPPAGKGDVSADVRRPQPGLKAISESGTSPVSAQPNTSGGPQEPVSSMDGASMRRATHGRKGLFRSLSKHAGEGNHLGVTPAEAAQLDNPHPGLTIAEEVSPRSASPTSGEARFVGDESKDANAKGGDDSLSPSAKGPQPMKRSSSVLAGMGDEEPHIEW